MSDAMQIARQRRKQHEHAIATKESEIEELREMIADLDGFLEFGEVLIGTNGEATQEKLPDARDQKDDPRHREIEASADDEDDDENDADWVTESARENIANVLAARQG